MSQLKAVVHQVGENNIKPLDMADIHKGWMRPHHGPQLLPEERLGQAPLKDSPSLQ